MARRGGKTVTDWRRYTTTPRPQAAWTGLVALGLVVFGLRERRHWT